VGDQEKPLIIHSVDLPIFPHSITRPHHSKGTIMRLVTTSLIITITCGTAQPMLASDALTIDLTPLTLVLPKPNFLGTPRDLPAHLKKRLDPKGTTAPPTIMVPRNAINLAHKAPVTSSEKEPIIGELTQVTDGDLTPSSGSIVELGPGTQWVQIDLGAPVQVWAVALWRNLDAENTTIYHDVVVQVSDDADFTTNVRTLFNNDDDNSSGLGAGRDYEYYDTNLGKVIEGKGTKARYVRCSSGGNTDNEFNRYIEIEVWGTK
jgi:hypothetical protein